MSKQTCPACYGYGTGAYETTYHPLLGVYRTAHTRRLQCGGRGTVDAPAPITCPTCGAPVEPDALKKQTMPDGTLMWPQPFCRACLLAGLKRLDVELRQPRKDGDA